MVFSARTYALPLVFLAALFVIRGPVRRERRARLEELLNALQVDAPPVSDEVVEKEVLQRTLDNRTFMLYGDAHTTSVLVAYSRRSRGFTVVRQLNVAHRRLVYSFPSATDADIDLPALADKVGVHCRKNFMWLLNGAAPRDMLHSGDITYVLCDTARVVRRYPHAGDEELPFEVVHGVGVNELMAHINVGAMQSDMIAGALLAIERLRPPSTPIDY